MYTYHIMCSFTFFLYHEPLEIYIYIYIYIYICKSADGGHGSANESAIYPQPNTQHPLQPPSVSHMEDAGLQREEQVQVSFMDSWAHL